MRLFAEGRYAYTEASMPAGSKPYRQRPVRRGGGGKQAQVVKRLVSSKGLYFKTSQSFFMSNIINRVQDTTPKFFKLLRNIGVTLAAVSAAVFAAPVELPAIITKIAGYLAVAGSVMGAVSQTAVLHEEE